MKFTPRRAASVAAVAVMVAFPLAALQLVPSARADDSPGANLAGVNANATSTGLLFAPLTPGLVGAGNVSTGDLIETAIPYATASTSTGPSNSGLASPAYPGDTASQLGNLFNTFSPLPPAVQTALNDPVLARSDYPPQVAVGSSASYAPPTGSAAGALSASTQSTPAGTTAQAALSQTSLPSALISISSTTTSSATELGASSVKATAHSDIGKISLLNGAVVIAGVSSDATATSDGNNGQQTSDLKVGQVTVAGQSAYIGPDGIHLSSPGQGGTLVPALNAVLAALQQAGISVHTIAPASTTDGASAQVTSAALQISFLDQHIPNPNGVLPLNTIGFNLDIGISAATADATALPPFASSGPSDGGLSSGLSAGGSTVGSTGGGLVTSTPDQSGVAAPSLSGSPSLSSGSAAPTVASPPPTGAARSGGAPIIPGASPASVLGAPVKVAWVVIAFLLSLVVAGPLLGYANWQLLRGGRS